MRPIQKIVPKSQDEKQYIILGMKVMVITLAAILLLAGVVFYLPSKSKHFVSVSISHEQFNSWPLVVPNGIISNFKVNGQQNEIVFETPTHQFYGLNGTAINHGYADIHEITKKDVSKPDQYMDVSDLIRFGSALEKEPQARR